MNRHNLEDPSRVRPPRDVPLRDGALPDPVHLDTKGYFYRFCQAHGEPETIRGVLVFRDGWTYNAYDHAGPEYAPPNDPVELDKLVTTYWINRLSRCKRALDTLIAAKERVEAEQRKRSLPLQQRVRVKDESGAVRTGSVPLSTAQLDAKIGWLRADIDEAVAALRQIELYYKKLTDVEDTK